MPSSSEQRSHTLEAGPMIRDRAAAALVAEAIGTFLFFFVGKL